MRKIEKSELYGIVGAITAGVLLILILLFCKLSYRLLHEEEGLSANFGDVLQGQGLYEPAPASVLETSTPKPVNPPPPSPAEDHLLTQSNEESLALAEAKKKEQKRREEERIRQREEDERRRIEQEKIEEQKRIEAEKARQAAEIKSRAQGAFTGAGTQNSSGEGTGGTSGNQGNPFGDNSSNRTGAGVGSSYKLGGRGLVGALPKPADNTQVEGVIVIEITVDEKGVVTKADFGKGTTIVEASARNAALSAAKKAKFTTGNKQEIGTITYRFSLN